MCGGWRGRFLILGCYMLDSTNCVHVFGLCLVFYLCWLEVRRYLCFSIYTLIHCVDYHKWERVRAKGLSFE